MCSFGVCDCPTITGSGEKEDNGGLVRALVVGEADDVKIGPGAVEVVKSLRAFCREQDVESSVVLSL